MLIAKKTIDAALAVISAAKAAFDNLKSVTLFIVDLNLQFLVAGKGQNKNHYKEITCDGVQGNQIIAVFQNEQDYCAPHYSDVETAKN